MFNSSRYNFETNDTKKDGDFEYTAFNARAAYRL